MNSGSRLRNVHLATALAQRCPVTLLQVLQPGDQSENPPETASFDEMLVARKSKSYTPGKIFKGVLGPLPVTVVNYESEDVAQCLRAALQRNTFDVVQMETSNLFSYLHIVRSAPGSPSVLLDWHNIDSELMFRYASEAKSFAKRVVAKRTADLLVKLETRLLQVCDAHTVVSERDKAELLKRNPAAKISVVPNGVDSSKFACPETSSLRSNLLFVGSMDYHANVDAVMWFTREVWPALSQRFPDLEFTIAGRSPGKEIQMLASEKIHVTGTVDDVRPYYAQAFAVIVPLRIGSGTRLKILEAMSMGVPVISTSLGAEGIAVTDTKDILLADSEQAIEESVGCLLTDRALALRLAGAARKLVTDHYDWARVGDLLFNAHCELAETRVCR